MAATISKPISTLGPPSSVLLHFQQSSLTLGESTVVECTAVGGEPREAFNLTLWRNNEFLTGVNGDRLSYSTEHNPFGTYRCAVGNIQNSSVMLERGIMFHAAYTSPALRLLFFLVQFQLLTEVNFTQCGYLEVYITTSARNLIFMR